MKKEKNNGLLLSKITSLFSLQPHACWLEIPSFCSKENVGSQTNTYHTPLSVLWKGKLAGGTIHGHIKEKAAFSAPHAFYHSSFQQAGQPLVRLVCSCGELQLRRFRLGHDATYQKLNRRHTGDFWDTMKKEIPTFSDKAVHQDAAPVAGKPSERRSAPRLVV